MSNQLQKRLEHTIAVEGCEFGEDALVFRRVDAEVLAVAGGLLQKWEKKASWYWGDYMVAYCDFQLREEEAERRAEGKGPLDEMVRGEKLERYAAQYAEAAGVEPQTLRLRKSVAAFFGVLTRVNGLDWEHHRIAKWGSGGDLAVAQELLALAKEKGWKASRLKAHINSLKLASEESDEPSAQTILPMEVVECRRWASSMTPERVRQMPMEEARALLVELSRTAEVIAWLTRRVHPTLAALPAADAGGKESLSA